MTTGTIAASTAAFAGSAVGTTDDGAATGANGMSASSALTVHTVAGQSAAIGMGERTASGMGLTTGVAPKSQLTSTALLLAPGDRTVGPNTPVVIRALLFDPTTRKGIPNQKVRVVRAIDSRWHTTAVLRTDTSGFVQITARLLTTSKINAVFDGGGGLRGTHANSNLITIKLPDPPATTSTGTGGGGTGTVDSGSTSVPASSLGGRAVQLAAREQGKPYEWGAEGPNSFDCSGLVQYVFNQLGRTLPRTADAQYQATTHVARSAKQPGDLIFFGSPGSIYHVGIYAGNDMMWNAPETGEVVKLRPIYNSSYLVGRVS